MRSVLGLTALWLVFGGMHIGLATCRVRDGPGSDVFGNVFATVDPRVLVRIASVH